MKRFYPVLLILALVVTMAFTACGGSKAVNSVASSPQVVADQKKAEKIVEGCVKKIRPKKIIKCIAPPGHRKELAKCAEGVVQKDGVPHSKAQKEAVIKDLSLCVERYR